MHKMVFNPIPMLGETVASTLYETFQLWWLYYTWPLYHTYAKPFQAGQQIDSSLSSSSVLPYSILAGPTGHLPNHCIVMRQRPVPITVFLPSLASLKTKCWEPNVEKQTMNKSKHKYNDLIPAFVGFEILLQRLWLEMGMNFITPHDEIHCAVPEVLCRPSSHPSWPSAPVGRQSGQEPGWTNPTGNWALIDCVGRISVPPPWLRGWLLA